MAVTVVFALIGSLLLSLTYVPAALTFVLRGKVAETESPIARITRRWYEPAWAFVMRQRIPALTVALVLVMVSGALFPFLLYFIRIPIRTNKQRTATAVHRELEFLRAMLNFVLANGWLERSLFRPSAGRSSFVVTRVLNP